jgi:hypothetical protein
MPYKNKEDQNRSAREWYQRNKKQHIAKKTQNQRERSKKYKLKLFGLRGNKCFDCGYDININILEFHHLSKPDARISTLLSRGLSWKKILIESKKCVLLCPNCHAIRHLK